MLQWVDKKYSDKHATATPWHLACDLGDSLVIELQKLWISRITTVMAFGGAREAWLYRMVELMNPDRIAVVVIMISINNMSRSSESMGVEASVPNYCSIAEISVRCNDRLHNTHGCEDTDRSYAKTLWESDQVEQRSTQSGQSQCWRINTDGFRA